MRLFIGLTEQRVILVPINKLSLTPKGTPPILIDLKSVRAASIKREKYPTGDRGATLSLQTGDGRSFKLWIVESGPNLSDTQASNLDALSARIEQIQRH